MWVRAFVCRDCVVHYEKEDFLHTPKTFQQKSHEFIEITETLARKPKWKICTWMFTFSCHMKIRDLGTFSILPTLETTKFLIPKMRKFHFFQNCDNFENTNYQKYKKTVWKICTGIIYLLLPSENMRTRNLFVTSDTEKLQNLRFGQYRENFDIPKSNFGEILRL